MLLLDPAASDDVVGLMNRYDTAIWAAWDLANGHAQNAGDQDRRLVQETRLRNLRPPRRR